MRNTYRITASYEHAGARLECTNAPTLGEYLHERFTSKMKAEEARKKLQREIGIFGLDASTLYRVEVCA
jgi:hypothetical protein